VRLRSFHYGCSFRVFQRVAAEFSVVGPSNHFGGGEGSYNATIPLSLRKGKGVNPSARAVTRVHQAGQLWLILG
jgi:hypothetical protein